MDPETQRQLVDMLDQGARTLGAEGTRLWPQIVARTFAYALIWAVLEPGILAACAFGIVWIWRAVHAKGAALERQYHERKSQDAWTSRLDYDAGGYQILGLLVAGLLLIIAGIALSDWPGQLVTVLYPEATALQQLLRSVKP